MTIDKNITVCFSGHRPEKLPDNGDENSYLIKMIKSMLYKEIIESYANGCNCFITGLARGVDLWAGEMVLEMKAKHPDVKLVAAVPHKGHGESLKGTDKWIYGNITAKADMIVYVCESYNNLCMKKRNEFMVDNSCKLIAVVYDYKSGTGQTISYANKSNVDTKIIDVKKISSTFDKYQTSLL